MMLKIALILTLFTAIVVAQPGANGAGLAPTTAPVIVGANGAGQAPITIGPVIMDQGAGWAPPNGK